MTPPEQLRPLWVFGYGSLIWHPGFPVAEQSIAVLQGYHRSFCMSSIHHRGTVEKPGLVLALDPAPGHSCRGVALRVEDGHEAETLSGLRERELVSSAYLEAVVDITLSNGHQVTALTYIVDQDHVQYCGGMELEKQATIIAQATGGRGDNTEYLWNTSRHLEQLGIDDPELRWLDRRVRALKQS